MGNWRRFLLTAVYQGGSVHLIKGQDAIQKGAAFEPNQFSGLILFDGCGITAGDAYQPITSGKIYATIQNNFGFNGYRLRVGFEPQIWNASTTTWDEWDWGIDDTVNYDWRHGKPLVRSIEVKENTNKKDCYSIEFVATNMGPLEQDDTPADDQPCEVAVNMVSRPRQVNAYRTEDPNSRLVFPTYGVTGCSGDFGWEGSDYFGCTLADIDIAGQPIDFNGQPARVAIEQTYITIDLIVRGPYQSWFGTHSPQEETFTDPTYVNILDAQETWVNRRNIDDGLFGYAQGELLCNDISIQPLHYEYKRVSFSFIRDEWFHMEQIPWMPGGTKIETIDYCGQDDDEMVYLNAQYVTWRQSYLMGFSVCGGPNGTDGDYFRYPAFRRAWAQITGTTGDRSFVCEPCS
tara:strand:+ start:2620 stop:3828 length:1209 start_codon:yes stop_codon:yes gene_type:complete